MAGKKNRIFDFSVPASARAAVAPLFKNRLLAMESRVVPQMKWAMENYMQDVIGDALANTELGSITGDMAKSLYDGTKVTGTKLNTLKGEYRGNEYTRIHEFGGTIRPKNAEVLTLPLPAALRPDGTPKLKSPRSWKRFGTFSWTSPDTGQGYLVYRKGDKLVFLYVYVDTVKMPARLGLREAHNKNLDSLMAVWLQIFASEFMNVDLMSIIDNPAAEAKLFSKSYAVAKKFNPKVPIRKRRIK